MSSPKITARDVSAALYHHFVPRWAMLTEVSARPVQVPPPPGQVGRWYTPGKVRRIDVLLVRAANVIGDIERLAIEIKVSRSDFLADVRNPSKQAPWRELAHRHAYAVPDGLVTPDEVPTDSGLITVHPREGGRATVKFARNAPKCKHEPGPLPLANIMDAFWRAGRAEALMKGFANHTANGAYVEGEDLGELRANVAHLQRELGLAQDRHQRMREQRDDWRRRYAAHEPPPCVTCGGPLYPARGSRARYDGVHWEHRDEFYIAICDGLRKNAAQAAHDALPTSERRPWRLEVLPPEPVDALTIEVSAR